MRNYSRSHLSRPALARQLQTNTAGCNEKTADQLADIAEFDVREQYLEEAHPSMTSYCVHVLRLSDDSARHRIHAARIALQYPVIFEMIADARLNISAVLMLATYLSPANAEDLLTTVANKTRLEIDQILTRRFHPASQPMLPPVAEPATPESSSDERPPDWMENDERAPGRVQNETVGPPTSSAIDSPARAPWPVTVDPADHEKLRFAQSLLRHQIPNGDLNKVLSRLIDLGLAQLQKKKCGTGVATRSTRRPSSNPRHIPTVVKQAVWQRDGGQCTFRSESGNRCPCRDYLEIDHIVPVARGGLATVDNLRLRCRAHNQFEAERTFGADFMRYKRDVARAASPRKTKPEEAPMPPAVAEVIPWLRGLGFKIAEANAAASLCENMASEPLEKRVRVALSYFRRSRASGAALAT